MVKSALKFFLICLISMFMVACNQIIQIEEEEQSTDENPPEVTLDEELAFEAVNSYYTLLINQRYAMALFHVNSSENPSDTVMDLESLNYIEETLAYSVDQFKIDREKTNRKDEEIIFFATISVSYHEQKRQTVIERVHVTRSEGLYKISNIQSWDMFIPYRSHRYIIEPPREVLE
jgi:ABC-type multidrug transport system fused ATPase/permease subunit